VEPRTPKSSFQFRGPAAFSRGEDGALRFTLNSAVYIPYPQGFSFPRPDLAAGLVIGPDSALDPYLQLDAVCTGPKSGARLTGGEHRIRSTRNEEFSYSYALNSTPAATQPGAFEYINHSDNDARFTATSISAISGLSAGARRNGYTPNAVNFTAFGTWSLDSKPALHVAVVEISRAPGLEYVSILIDGGQLANVNTRPEKVTPPLEPVH
jgi:hypothetical protein